MKTLLTTVAAGVIATTAAADLTITPYVANEGSLFPVSSSMIEGPTEVVLIDAQFEKDDAEALVEMIRATGKTLTTVYISHKDPDFYFGLDTIRAAFPDAQFVATPATVDGIAKTIEGKFETWAPALKDNAPSELIVPDVIDGDSLTVDGETVQIVGFDGHDPARTFLWVPSEETALGGVILFENMHVWMADTQTEAELDNWRKTLDDLLALEPARILPGHVNGESAEDASIVSYTRGYIDAFVAASAAANGSEELMAAIQEAYPELGGGIALQISAKVFEGEQQWP